MSVMSFAYLKTFLHTTSHLHVIVFFQLFEFFLFEKCFNLTSVTYQHLIFFYVYYNYQMSFLYTHSVEKSLIRKSTEISVESLLYQEISNDRLKIYFTSILNNFISQSLSNHPRLIITSNQNISNLNFSKFHSSQIIISYKICITPYSHAIIFFTQ